MNQFALKAQIQQHIRDKDEQESGFATKTSNLKIKDEASSDEEDGDEQLDGDTRAKKSKGKKKVDAEKERKKSKKQRVDNADEVAAYESEDGDDEGREYDYISDSGSDTEWVFFVNFKFRIRKMASRFLRMFFRRILFSLFRQTNKKPSYSR